VIKALAFASLFLSTAALCQSNDNGTLQLGAGAWVTLGGTSIKSVFDTSGTIKGSGLGAKVNVGVKAQYGLSEKISLGVIIRREAAIYYTDYTYDNTYFTPTATDVSSAGFSYGTEVKYYLINKNPYNLFANSYLGYYSGNATLKLYNADGNLNGLCYGLGGGFNWYWGYEAGMALDFAFVGQSLSGVPDNAADFDDDTERITKYHIGGIGIYIGLAFIIRFERDLKNPIM
jgi:hypothetical protein